MSVKELLMKITKADLSELIPLFQLKMIKNSIICQKMVQNGTFLVTKNVI